MTQATSSRVVGLRLEPLDVLFFRDGRPFGASTRVESGQPMPQTLAGAIWTALLQKYGCDFRELGRKIVQERKPFPTAVGELCAAAWITEVRIRGPWLAQFRDGTLDVLIPVPAVLHEAKRQTEDCGPLHRLFPLQRGQQPPGWQPLEPGLRALWIKRSEPTEAVSGYLTSKGTRAFLSGGVPERQELRKNNSLFGFDHRTGIEIAADQLSAREGGIYGISLLALQKDVNLYIEPLLPDNAPADALAGLTSLPLGGEGRRVAVHPCTGKSPCDGYEATPRGRNQKPLIVLTTPGLFASGWKPQALDGHLVAAAVPGAVAVSGWDMARGGPKPTRFAVAAGSVYYLDSWPDELPDGVLSDNPDDRAQGWGCYLKGVWIDE